MELTTMTNEEGREAIRSLLAKWETCVRIVMEGGFSQADAEEAVGHYFSEHLGLVRELPRS